MNEILRRTKESCVTVFWEPLAASTPLKAVLRNKNVEVVPQNPRLLHEAPVNIAGRLQNGFANSKIPQHKLSGLGLFPSNNTSKHASCYFDILASSSSDEDESSENQKRPIIKINSTKKTRSLLCVKKLENKETEKVKKSSDRKKQKKPTSDKQLVSVVMDDKQTVSQPPDGIGKPQNPTKRLHSSLGNDNFSSDEENNMLGETETKKSMRSIKSCLKSKDNVIKITKITEILGKSEKQGLKAMPEINGTPATSNKVIVSKEEKGSHETVSECYKVPKTPKKRSKKIMDNLHPVKRTRSRKVPEESPAEPLQPLGSPEVQPPVMIKKHNLSHQLFSDSRDQELRNMLDLTKEENNEAAELVKHSVTERENDVPVQPLKSPHPSTEIIYGDEIKQERPKRTRQIPKMFWLPENMSNKPVSKIGTNRQTKQAAKDNQEAEVLKKTVDAGAISRNNKEADQASTKRQKSVKQGKRRVEHAVQEDIVQSSEVMLKDTEQKVLNHPPPTAQRSKDEELNQKPESTSQDRKRQRVKMEQPVFQRLNELSYNTNETGCSLKECWGLRNFKCGIFRLEINSQFTCKTLHKNSHWGGVLIKGELKMKIGDKDVHLKEGDMAFVPPLTNWQATNIGDCESTFYYWCGGFTS